MVPWIQTIQDIYYLGEYQLREQLRISAGLRLDYGRNDTRAHHQLIDVNLRFLEAVIAGLIHVGKV